MYNMKFNKNLGDMDCSFKWQVYYEICTHWNSVASHLNHSRVAAGDDGVSPSVCGKIQIKLPSLRCSLHLISHDERAISIDLNHVSHLNHMSWLNLWFLLSLSVYLHVLPVLVIMWWHAYHLINNYNPSHIFLLIVSASTNVKLLLACT